MKEGYKGSYFKSLNLGEFTYRILGEFIVLT